MSELTSLFLQLPTLTKVMSYVMFCLGSAWLVRAGIFGIVVDPARLLIPFVIVLFHQSYAIDTEAELILAILVGLAAWATVMGLFLLSRERFQADDILLSLGLMSLIIGLSTFGFRTFFGQNYMVSPAVFREWNGALIVLMAAIAAISIYLLSFSNLRIILAYAQANQQARGIYPKGLTATRIIATMAAAVCVAIGSVAQLTDDQVSLHQYKDQIGILLFGVAYALRGRAIYCVVAAIAMGYAQPFSDSRLVDHPTLHKLLAEPQLIVGLIVIVLGLSFNRR